MFKHPTRGFTLLEVLVALAIFALVSVMAFRGLTMMLDTRERVTQQGQKWQDLSRLYVRLQQDLSRVVNRPIRNSWGTEVAALVGEPNPVGDDDALLSFTRMGLAGQTGRLQGLQRFGYRLRGNKVEMLSWTSLDQAPRVRPMVDEVLSGAASLKANYLDMTGTWHDRWPMTNQQPVPPVAVKLNLVLLTGEHIEWLFVVQ
ncbi:MAG: type II secretion system minor pseudopilin GspJ [Gallionella sp.]|nr:type II secretion system minor pseudopilin GspJ [Gallionella sp.]